MKIEELQKNNQECGTFTCHYCKNIYDINREWDPVTEAKELWGEDSKRDDQVVLCDDCFKNFMEYRKSMIE